MRWYHFLLMLEGVMTISMARAGELDQLKDFTGILYDEIGRVVGLPMGGAGAGCFEITNRGTLEDFANVNNWVCRIPSIPGTGLWVTVTQEGKTTAYPLAGGKVKFEGNFPFAKLTFPDLPVEVTLWTWSPLVLHDVKQSGYPVAIFDAEFHNKTDKPAEYGLALAYGTDYSEWLRMIATSHLDMLETTGFHEWEVLRNAANQHSVHIDIDTSSSLHQGAAAEGIRFATKARIDHSVIDSLARDRKGLEEIWLQNYDFKTVDLTAVCNNSYAGAPFHKQAEPGRNFDTLQPGEREIYNIPFNVLDDAATKGKSFVMAGPFEEGPKSVTIPVAQKADALFFFGNIAAWAADGSCQYVIHYADGSAQTVPLRIGMEISEFWGQTAKYSPFTLTGMSKAGTGWQVQVYGVKTDGTKEVQSVEVKREGHMSPMIFAITAGKLAATPLVEGIKAARNADIDKMVGNPDSLKTANATDANYTVAARKKDGARTLTYAVASTATVQRALESAEKTNEKDARIFATEQRLALKPGESGVAGLVCAWYAPNHRNLEGHVFGHKYEEWFADSAAVAEEVAREHAALLAKTKEHFDIIATSTYPKWFREMAQSNFYQMCSTTWLTKDGISFTYESPDRCPALGTNDVRYYGSFTKLASFPELDEMELRDLAHHQRPDGFVPHDVGVGRGLADIYIFPKNEPAVTPSSKPEDCHGDWVNLPIKFCLQVARDYQWTGNRAYLEELWPNVKRAMAWIDARDYNRCGLPESYYSYDGWTMSGTNGYDANQWLPCLLAVARLADDLGEHDYAKQLRETHKKGLEKYLKEFWNGKYFRQGLRQGGGTDELVSCLQVAGDWYGTMLGYETGVPKDKIHQALQTVDDINGKDAVYGTTVALNPDGTSNGIWQCYVAGTGWSLYLASQYIYEGMDTIGLRLADEIWRQFMVRDARMPWRQEEVIEDPHTGKTTDRLPRDMRLGVTMAIAQASSGLYIDVPAGTMAIKPANWVWKEAKIVLPVVLPTWLGQAKVDKSASGESWTLTSLEKPQAFKSLKLRTDLKGEVKVTVGDLTRTAQVGANGTVEAGPVSLEREIKIMLAPVK